jgi:hypothetical protein
MPAVVLKSAATPPFGAPGNAAEFLDRFLETAGLTQEHRWEARLDKTAACGWDSPPVRVVGYKGRIIYLRVKPSLNAAVDHLARLLIPNGAAFVGETVYRRLSALVPSFNRVARAQKRRKTASQRVVTAAGAALDVGCREESPELADARRRLEANRQRHRQLQAEMKMLDEEFQEITKLLASL